MPLFSSHHEEEAPPPRRKGSIFSRSRSPLKDTSTNHHNNNSFFGPRSPPSDDSVSSHVRKDPSIVGAKQKVTDAQDAEKAADRALHEARNAVKEAVEHVKRLEREIAEE
jgi:hypothetical protein